MAENETGDIQRVLKLVNLRRFSWGPFVDSFLITGLTREVAFGVWYETAAWSEDKKRVELREYTFVESSKRRSKSLGICTIS